jgi:hypothetical protein
VDLDIAQQFSPQEKSKDTSYILPNIIISSMPVAFGNGQDKQANVING